MVIREFKLYWIAFSADGSFMLFIFAITRLMAENQSTILELGILGGLSSICYALIAPLGGRCSDIWGRRQVIAVGTAAHIVIILACVYLQLSTFGFYIMGALVGASVGFLHPPVIAWLTQGGVSHLGSNLTSQRLFWFCVSWNVGMITGQALGGWSFPVDPVLPLWIAFFLMSSVLIVILFENSSINPPIHFAKKKNTDSLEVQESLRTFVYLGWTANITGAMGMSLIIYLLPHLIHELGISSPIHGMMLVANRITVLLTYSIMKVLTFWRYRFSITLLVQFIALIGLMFLTYSSTILFLTIGLILFAFLTGYNYFSSIFYSTTSFDGRHQGLASGIHEATLAIGFGVGSFGGGIVGVWGGSRVPYQMVSLVLLLCVLIQLLIYYRRRELL